MSVINHYFKKGSYYINMVIYLSLTVFFVTSIGGMLFYLYFNKTLREETYNSNREILEQTSNLVEMTLKQVEKTALTLSQDENVRIFVNLEKDQHNNYLSLNELVNMFKAVRMSTEYLHSIYVMNTANNRVYINSNLYGSTLYDLQELPEKNLIEDFIKSRRTQQWLETRTITNIMGQTENVITYLFRVGTYDSNKSGVLVINLKESLLYDSVVNINRQKLGNTAILGKDNKVLSYGDKSKLYNYIYDETILERFDKKMSGYITLRNSNGSMLATYITSPFNNWKYVSLIPVGEVYKKANAILISAVTISVISILLGIFTVLFISVRIYMPIREIANLVPFTDSPGIKSNSRNELTSIKDYMGSLRKENERFREDFHRYEVTMKEHFLLNLLLGRYLNRQEIYRQILYYNLDMTMENFMVVILKLDFGDKPHSTEEERNLARFSVVELCKSFLPLYCKGAVVDYDINHIALIINFVDHVTGEESAQKGRELAYSIIHNVREQIGIVASAGIGMMYENPVNIRLSFQEAFETLLHEKIAGKGCVLYIHDIRNGSDDRKFLASFEAGKIEIINSMKLGSLQAGNDALDKFFRGLEDQKNISFELKNVLLMQAANAVILAAMDIAGRVEGIFGKGINPYYECSRLDSLLKIKEWFYKTLQKVIELTCEFRKNKNSELVGRILRYIDENYSRPISIKELTGNFYLSTTQFCTLFKDVTGKTFGDYLAEIRIEKSCRMLIESSKSLNEISEVSGFGDKQNMIRTFKKHFAMTPTQYREKHIRI